MALSEVVLTISDGALGIVGEAVDGVTAKIGCCSIGADAHNQFFSFGDKATLRNTLGIGPLVEAAAYHLDVAGGPIYCVPVSVAVAGVAGPISKQGTSPDITLAGAALDAFSGRVNITSNGGLGAGTFRYSLDGGNSYSVDIMIPSAGAYLIPDSGLTITFTAGAYVKGDYYLFTCSAPQYDATGLFAALNGLLSDPREWRFVHVVGCAKDAPGCAAMAAVVDSVMSQVESNARYCRAFIEAPDVADQELIAAFASFSSTRVGVAAGSCELISSLSGRSFKRSAAWPAFARAGKGPVHEDWGRVASGSLPGVTKLYRDERVTPGLDAMRFVTLHTFVGLTTGPYVSAGRFMAAPTSDFQFAQHGFVMDKACRIIRVALLKYLCDDIRVDEKTGNVLESDAQAIEADILSQLRSGLGIGPSGASKTANASSVEFKVTRNNNILSTQTLQTTARIVPKGYPRRISVDIGLLNPALVPIE